MTTSTQTLYSRPIPFSEAQAQPGDQINTANRGEPYWQTLIAVVKCTEENGKDYPRCYGGCAVVLHLQPGPDDDDCDLEFWHVDDRDTVETRLPAGGAW